MGFYSNARQRQEEQGRGFGLVFAILLGVAAMFVEANAARADGLRLEMGRGQCEQNRGGKGSWWNDHYRTFLDLNDSCYQVGFSATPWKWRGYDVGVRFAYVDLGRVRENAVMAVRDEDQLSNPDGSACDWQAWGSGCLMTVRGGGHPRGFTAGPIIERRIGDMVLGAEAGMFVYYNHFTVRLTAYPDERETPDWWWWKWDLARGWNATPYLGANVRVGWLTASVRTYAKVVAHSRETGQSGVTNGEAWQVNVGLSIPVTL